MIYAEMINQHLITSFYQFTLYNTPTLYTCYYFEFNWKKDVLHIFNKGHVFHSQLYMTPFSTFQCMDYKRNTNIVLFKDVFYLGMILIENK